MAKAEKKKKMTESERFMERILAIKDSKDVEGVSERQKLQSMNDLKALAAEKGGKDLTFAEIGDVVDSIGFTPDQIDDIYDYVCALAMYDMPDITDLNDPRLLERFKWNG